MSNKFVFIWTFFISHATWRERDKVNCSSHGICFFFLKSIISHWNIRQTSEGKGREREQISETPSWDQKSFQLGSPGTINLTRAHGQRSTGLPRVTHYSPSKEFLSNTYHVPNPVLYFTWFVSLVLRGEGPERKKANVLCIPAHKWEYIVYLLIFVFIRTLKLKERR